MYGSALIPPGEDGDSSLEPGPVRIIAGQGRRRDGRQQKMGFDDPR